MSEEDARAEYRKAMGALHVCADTASRHVHRAVELGSREAMFRLGLAHCERPWDFSLGLARSPRFGRELLKKAAALGELRAECLLAVSYLKGSCRVRRHCLKGRLELQLMKDHNPLGETMYKKLQQIRQQQAAAAATTAATNRIERLNLDLQNGYGTMCYTLCYALIDIGYQPIGFSPPPPPPRPAPPPFDKV